MAMRQALLSRSKTFRDPTTTLRATQAAFTQAPTAAPFSSRTRSKKLSTDPSENDTHTPNPQAFVTQRFTPGEYSPHSTVYPKRFPKDPLFRPPWKNKAKIISAEDFANQPKVVFEEQYESMHDAMMVLSWLTEEQRQGMYTMYCNLMTQMASKHDTTSHEYIMRVIAQKFNVTPMRAAAIVEMIHDEEQLSRTEEGSATLHYKLQELVDAKIQEHIKNCYACYEEDNPNEFVEGPVESGGLGRTQEFTAVSDLLDVDQLAKEATLREKDEAQQLIDSKVYLEDIRDSNVLCKVNAECKQLINIANESLKDVSDLMDRNKEDELEYGMPDRTLDDEEDEDDDEEGDDGDEDSSPPKPVERRPRWKYVAQLVNVREQKKNGKKSRRGGKLLAKKHYKENSIVEEGGELRVATMDEVKGTAWKPMRNDLDFVCQGAKDAWLRRIHDGERNGWGRVPENLKFKPEEKVEEEAEEEQNDEENVDDEQNEKESDDNEKQK
jgi:hypothetical protein